VSKAAARTELLQSLSEIWKLCYEHLTLQIKAAPLWQGKKQDNAREDNPGRELKTAAEFYSKRL
jgi:hypothetical protein